ncbi:MAG: tripartite tricarboxylate transporter substrate binding protein, partial [Betaproteobacteria bacterium]|nr:tripartite tricarboxylate transporter substrate binding protein [Betaproteobacteria bacterium]
MLRTCAFLLASLAVPAALGQSYPAKPLRLIVPFSAGGSSDVLARGVAKQLGEQMGEPVVVENRAGAGGMIALEFVAKSAGDGYTLLFGTIGTNGIGPALYKNLNFDPVKDLAPVSSLHALPNVLLVNAGVPVKTVAELIGLAKAEPGKLTFASAGSGSASHLSGVLLKSATGIDILHVPYKGGGTAMPDVLSGQVSMMIETATGALSAIRSAKVRA